MPDVMMSLQVTAGNECFVATIASVRLFALMSPHVNQQGAIFSVQIAALAAFEEFLSCVSPKVLC